MDNKHKIHAGITGLGSMVPDRVMTNDDWSKIVDTSDEWIFSRTGIRERRFADENMATSDLGLVAAQRALADAKVDPLEVELIIVATSTPDHNLFPSTAAILQDKLGCTKAAAFDQYAACSGFAYSVTTAAQFIESGMYKKVLVIAAEVLSKFIDKSDRSTCVLFGDGAGAVLLEPVESGFGLISSDLGTRGSGAGFLIVPSGGSRDPLNKETALTSAQYIQMNGKEVFKFAVNIMGESIERALAKAGLTPADIDLLVPHQANTRIIDSAMKRFGLSTDKCIVNLDRYGNTSSASIPLALDEAYKAGRLKKGDVVVFCGFGAGLTWGSNIVRWSK